MYISPNQIIAGRGLLSWKQNKLAERTGIPAPALSAYEKGYEVPPDRMAKIKETLEAEGIEFVRDERSRGVILRHNSHYNGL